MVSNEDILNKVTEVQGNVKVAMSQIKTLMIADTKHEELISGLYDEKNSHNTRLVTLETLNQSDSQHSATLADWIFRGIICLVALTTLYANISKKKETPRATKIEARLECIEQYFKTHEDPVTEGDMYERLKQLLNNNH